MVELVYNGTVEGIFSNSKIAKSYAKFNRWGTFSIFPLGTFMATDNFRHYKEYKDYLKHFENYG